MKLGRIGKLSILLMLISLVLYFSIDSIIYYINPTLTEHLIYRNYDIKYKQYWKGKRDLHTGHAIYNEDLYKQANLILANRLLDEYLQTKDSTLPKEITRIANSFNLSYPNSNFEFDEILRDRESILDTLILID